MESMRSLRFLHSRHTLWNRDVPVCCIVNVNCEHDTGTHHVKVLVQAVQRLRFYIHSLKRIPVPGLGRLYIKEECAKNQEDGNVEDGIRNRQVVGSTPTLGSIL